MAQFLVGRLGRMLLTMFGVVTLTFALGRLTGDPVALLLPQTATMEDYERIRASLGLDQPLPTQFVRYLGGVLQGDFGRSIVFNRPAWDVVAERIPATFELGVPALIVSIVLGIPLGIICARRRNSAFDRVIMSLSLAGQSMPAFFIGILLILFFGVQLRALPTFGRDTPAHLILPTVTLMVYPLAFIIRLTRSSLLEILSEPFIRTANAKGLSGQRVLYIHALRNALIPVLTVVGLQVAAIISGAAIIETVFAWPGIGLLAAQSIGARDYPVIQTVVIFSALAFGLTNMSVDLLYTTLDPRIRAEGGR